MNAISIDRRLFGKTGIYLTQVGLGGEGILRTYGKEREAASVIGEAVALGITYFDCAKAYAGSQGYYGNYWKSHPDQRANIFQASKSASRDKKSALADLNETLEAMGTGYLDLWQIHDVRTMEDVYEIEGRGGALEAFIEAKEKGIVRHIGVTGHHDPAILTYAVKNWPVDSVLLPVNPVEGALGGFMDETLPAARKNGVAIIGMKILGASNYVYTEAGITADLLIRYALSQDIDVAIVGCSNMNEVRALVKAGRSFKPVSRKEQEGLVDMFRQYSEKLAYYRGVI